MKPSKKEPSYIRPSNKKKICQSKIIANGALKKEKKCVHQNFADPNSESAFFALSRSNRIFATFADISCFCPPSSLTTTTSVSNDVTLPSPSDSSSAGRETSGGSAMLGRESSSFSGIYHRRSEMRHEQNRKVVNTHSKTDGVGYQCQTCSINEHSLYTRRMGVSNGSLNVRWE